MNPTYISINHINSLVKVEKDIPFPLALCHDRAFFFFSCVIIIYTCSKVDVTVNLVFELLI